MISILASMATILDFGLALYIFLSDKPKLERKFSVSSEPLSHRAMSNSKRMLVIALNGLLVGGVVCLILLYGITHSLFDIFVVFLLPLVFNFALGFTASNQKAASNRAILSCLFSLIGLVFAISAVTLGLDDLFYMFSDIWFYTIIVMFFAWMVSLLAYRLRNNPPEF